MTLDLSRRDPRFPKHAHTFQDLMQPGPCTQGCGAYNLGPGSGHITTSKRRHGQSLATAVPSRLDAISRTRATGTPGTFMPKTKERA